MSFLKKWRFVIIVLGIAILGLILTPTKFREPVKNYFWTVFKPISSAFLSVGRITPFFKDTFHFRSIIRQNSDLVKENLDLQSRMAKLSEVGYENEVLKKELGFMKSQDLTKTVPAAIIAESSGYLKSVVIDKGKNDNLSTGDAVISQGILVGTVGNVRQDNSDVILITDFNSLIPVILQNSRGTGLMRGGVTGLSVEQIPLNITLQKNENVVTSGLGGQIPGGILIGKTGEVISKEGEIFQKINVSSPIDFSRLEVLFVIKNE